MIQPSEIFEFEAIRGEGACAQTEWLVPADCPYLEGHFPGQPVLPAVAMIDGSLELFRRARGVKPAEGELHLKKAKFTGMVTPGMKVSLSLQHQDSRFDVDWKGPKGEVLASFSFRF